MRIQTLRFVDVAAIGPCDFDTFVTLYHCGSRCHHDDDHHHHLGHIFLGSFSPRLGRGDCFEFGDHWSGNRLGGTCRCHAGRT